MTPRFDSVTPMIPSGEDFEAGLRFYAAHLGFGVTWQHGNMAGLERDGVSFHLVHNSSREWAENASFSIGVHGLDSLYEQYRHVPAKVGPLELKAWGRREFHMIVDSGVCLQFYESAGQAIA